MVRRMWLTPDYQNSDEEGQFYTVHYGRFRSEGERNAAKKRAYNKWLTREYSVRDEVTEEVDPLKKFLYERQVYEKQELKRYAKLAEYRNSTKAEILQVIRARYTPDQVPVILTRKKEEAKEKIVAHGAVQNRRGRLGDMSAKQKSKVEKTAEDGDYRVPLFSRTFIRQVRDVREDLHYSQSDLAKMLNVPEQVVTQFERGELPYDGNLKALMRSKLSI